MGDIAITGVGTVSALGIGFEDYISSYKNKEPLISEAIDIDSYCGNIEIRRNDRFTKFGLAAFKDMMDNSSYLEIEPDERGVIANTYLGPLNTVNDFMHTAIDGGLSQASPMLFPNTVINAGLGRISIEYKLKGISYALCGTNPLFYALSELNSEHSKVVFVGGMDDAKSELAFIEGERSRFYESAVFIGLERRADAEARGAKALAYIKGIGSSNYVNRFDGADIAEEKINAAMKAAIAAADLKAEDISRVYLFSTDHSAETKAVKALFHENNYEMIYSRYDYRAFLSAGEFFTLFDAIIDMKVHACTGPVLVNIKAFNCMLSIVINL